MSPHDARLVPAALATWLTAALAVAVSTRVMVAMVGAALIVGVGALLGGKKARQGQGVRVRTASGAATRWAVRSQVLMVAAAMLLVTASAITQHALRHWGIVAELIAKQAVVQLEAKVYSPPRSIANDPNRYLLELEVGRIDGRGMSQGAHTRMIAWADNRWKDLVAGDQITLKGRLSPLPPGRTAVAEVSPLGSPEVTMPASGIDRVVATVHHSFGAVLQYAQPDTAALVTGIAIGDDSGLSAELTNAMRTVSLTHLTAVSGAHFAIIGACLLGLCLLMRLPRWASVLVTGGGLLALIAVVGPQPSVLRGGVMATIGLAGLLVGRRAQALPALSVAVIVLLAWDPWLSRSWGFMLSVTATGALILLAPVGAKWLAEKMPYRIAVAIAAPAAAQLACTPILLTINPQLATFGVIANVLALPAVLPATVFGVLAAAIAPVAPAVAMVLSWPASLAAGWIAEVARQLARLPGAALPWPGGVGGVAAFVGAVILLGLAVQGSWRIVSYLGCILAALAVIVLVWTRPVGGAVDERWQVLACDVGQGSATLIRTQTGVILVDVGPPDGDVVGCLRAARVDKIEMLVLSHPHNDHVGGLDQVLAAVSVDVALVPPLGGKAAEKVAAQLAKHQVATRIVSAGAQGEQGGAVWKVLAPPAHMHAKLAASTDPKAVNDASIAIRVEAGAPTGEPLSVIVLGDLEMAGQTALLNSAAMVASDVLIVAHHGSANQHEGLVAAIAAPVAIISSGKDNPYGHPAPSTLALLSQATVLRTDLCGAVAVMRVTGQLWQSGCQ